MKIETYELHEAVTPEETVQQDTEAAALVDSLGLKGQQALQTKTETTASRCPYRQMTKDEEFVFRTMCPARSNVSTYSASAIPLRVLQIIAWAQQNGPFQKLEVWYADSASVKDPVLVGYMQDPNCSWRELIFILARWADELLPIEVLMPDAYRRWWANKHAALTRDVAQLQTDLAQHNALKDHQHIPANL